MCMGWRGTLRVLRAETWLTVYRTIAMTRRAIVYRQVKLEEQYWCICKPRPRITATFYDLDLFEHVSR